MSNAFQETKNLFRTYTQYTSPLSYEEWLAIADDLKAAVLFVQFYDQITLAWYKTKSFFVEEENGVETMLQYLVKNVPIIVENPKRFSPNYIYRVAYNCLYCISHDIKRDIARFENETSNIVQSGDTMLDLFDTVEYSKSSAYEELTSMHFWNLIEDMGLETQKVVNHLLNGEPLKKVSRKAKSYSSDPLRDIEVSVDEMEKIIEGLKTKLDAFKSVYYV